MSYLKGALQTSKCALAVWALLFSLIFLPCPGEDAKDCVWRLLALVFVHILAAWDSIPWLKLNYRLLFTPIQHSFTWYSAKSHHKQQIKSLYRATKPQNLHF